MKKIALLVFTFLFVQYVNAQTCTAPYFKNQQQIDNFKIQNSNCKTISGNVTINGSDITNLNGLSGISLIQGSFTISENPVLTNLIGLESLVSVGGRLTISDNPALQDVSGLESLTTLTDGINVVSNSSLTNFSALKSLSYVGPYLRVVYNQSLTSIEGFNKITSVTDFLSVGGNNILESLAGLENITLAREVSISLNSKLRSLDGLRSLTKTTGYLYIGDNPLLTDLQGLNRLKSVSNFFNITSNDALTSLSGLDSLTKADALVISYSRNLSSCSVKAICSIINNNSDRIAIYSNATGCNSVEEVSYFCSSATAPIRINAGGNDFNASGARQFSADKYYAGIDRVSAVATGDILNTTDDELYRSARCSPFFSYNIPMPNGKVNVILHFAETWFGAPGKGPAGAGKRQFHVNIEGSRKLANFDIYAAAGGAMRAIQKSIPVTITDGMLNIDFMTGAADLPRICAIEVIVTSLTLKPAADAYVRDGSYNMTNFGSDAMLDVKYSANNPLSNRSSYLKFQLPVVTAISSAKLRIYGHNHENTKGISVHAYGVDDDSWTEYDIVKSNAPAASTASLGYAIVNDVYKYYEVDVSSYVIAQQQSGNAQVSLLLADPNNRNTRVIFNSMQNGAFPPQLIIQTPPVVNSNTRLNQQEITAESESQPVEESTVYPNPARDKFTVSLSMQHAGPIELELISESGKSYAIATPENSRPGEKTEVDISGLSLNAGIHLLKIKSDAATEVVKVLVAE